ncbi:hypothetical protein EGW08_017474, partial [Elysia chlorotica]
TGPMSSLLANAISCRAAVMLGGLFLSVGLALSALQNSLGMLFAFFGVVAGVGLGLTYTASVVVINYYFHRRRTMVTGIALSSAGLGIMLGPQISTLLFQMFSWREALGAMSVASAQVCVLGALMFPMHEGREREGQEAGRTPLVQRENLLDSQHPLHRGLFGIDLGKPSDLSNSHTSLKPTDFKTDGTKLSYLKNFHTASDTKHETSPDEPAQMSTSVLSLSHAHNHVSGKDPNRPLYRNSAFMLLCLQLFVANCACGVFNIHLPSFSKSKGLTDQEMTNILSINGLALFIGRMIVGALASATELHLLAYWALHMIGGLFIASLPGAGTSYLIFCFLIYGIGTFFGSVYSVLTSLTLKYVGLSRLATAFGLEMVCAGLGYLLAPPVAGWLVDLTGSYDYDMFCAGALLILSALLVMLLPILEPEITRDDLRRLREGGAGDHLGGIPLDVEVEHCADCLEQLGDVADAVAENDVDDVGVDNDDVGGDAGAADDSGGDGANSREDGKGKDNCDANGSGFGVANGVSGSVADGSGNADV